MCLSEHEEVKQDAAQKLNQLSLDTNFGKAKKQKLPDLQDEAHNL